MSDKKEPEVEITSIFGFKNAPGIKIEFDPEDPSKAYLMMGSSLWPAKDVKAVLAAFEDKFPFAFEEKKEG